MCKIYSLIVRLALTGIVSGIFCPVTLSATSYIKTLLATQRTNDNTALIQSYLDDPNCTKIIIPLSSSNASWPVRPLFFNHNNTEIHLNSNTVLEALIGGYPNGADCVLKATSLSNIKVTSDAGSKILMHKEEYALLTAAEWRHALNFTSCSSVTVSGVTLANTGGDGIYLGDADSINHTGYCSNVIIANVVTDGAGRNGLSVISVDGLTVTGCTFKNTKGQGNVAVYGPWAGIDLEPNYSAEQLKNIVISNCAFLNNGGYTGGNYLGSGFVICAITMGSSSILNLTFENCVLQNNAKFGIYISYIQNMASTSSMLFQNCTIKDSKDCGFYIGIADTSICPLFITNCYFKNNNISAGVAPIQMDCCSGGTAELNNIVIEQCQNRTVSYCLRITESNNVSGNVYTSGGSLSTINTTNINVTTTANTPQSWWKMDEASGSNANDSSGNCDGTLLNSPAWTIGRIGGGLTLNGNNQLVSVPNDASLNIGTGDFSISLWMQRSDNTATKRLLYKGASAADEIGYALAGSNTWLSLLISNGVTRVTAAGCSIPGLYQWLHVAFTVNRTSGKATSYLNGVYQDETDISAYNGSDISNTRDFLIGAASGGSLTWPGKIDDVRIYKRVLTPGEIADFASSASACWRLDDGSGSVAADSMGRSTGLLLNSPAWTTGKLGGAIALNGSNQLVSVSNNSSDLNIGTGDFSVALWMQRSDNAATNNRLLYKGASADNQIGYALAGSNTWLSLLISNGVTRVTAAGCSIPSLNQWHHVAFTVDRTSGKVTSYLNGVYQSQVDINGFSGGDISSTVDLLIGAASSTGWLAWPGKIDDVRIYKRVLSADEVLRLYSATP